MINLAYWPPVKRMIKNQRSAPNRSVAGGYAVCSLDSSIIAVRTLQRLEADTGQNESGLPQTTTLRYRQLSGRDLICNSIEQEERTNKAWSKNHGDAVLLETETDLEDVEGLAESEIFWGIRFVFGRNRRPRQVLRTIYFKID